MQRSVHCDASRRAVPARAPRRPSRAAFALLATMSLLALERSAAAQTCEVPQLDDDVCRDADGSIDSYKTCYRKLYDENVIPAVRSFAECSHARTDAALRDGLERSAALVTGAIKESLEAIEAALTAPGGPSSCIGNQNDVDDVLRPFIEAERNAPDLDAYRRANYTGSHFTFFTELLLAVRENRAACDRPLQSIRKGLVLLSGIKAHHLDYCQILRQSADYKNVTQISSLAQWTAVDPEIDFDQYFRATVTWNSQCGYFDFSGSGAGAIRYEQCAQATVEYSQTLVELNGLSGWLVDNRAAVIATSTAAAATIASLAGYGAASGPIGAAVGAIVGIVIAAVEYITLQQELDELNDLIALKESQLRFLVAAKFITEPQFHQKLEQLCSAWEPVVEQRVQDMVGALDTQKHIRTIDDYYTLSDGLHDWYNELFLWATQPGPGGQRFIDELSELNLLAQRDEFDQRIFAVRADQEVSAQKNTLTNIKGTVSLLACSNLSAPQQRIVRSRLSAGLRNFNRTCSTTMDAIAVAPDRPVAYANSPTESDVVCAYKGFRNDVASLEVRAGQGFSADMTIRNPAGAVVAELTGITSDTDFAQIGLPGFVCSSEEFQPFGTSAESQLAAATYPLRLGDNIFGFDDADAAALRSFTRSLDSQMRFKEVVCTRQLGTPVTVPSTADACGIPVPF
jgi:hypothetical protein